MRPATQERKNTFWLFVNEKLWLPDGNNGNSNLDAGYDLMYASGLFDLDAYRIGDTRTITYTYMSDLNKIGTYIFVVSCSNYPFDYSVSCYYDIDNSINRKGWLITLEKFSRGFWINNCLPLDRV